MTGGGVGGATILAIMVAGGYLNAKQEAQLVGRAESQISRARKKYPDHPANGPKAIPAGRDRVLAPRRDVEKWWAAWTPKRPGKPAVVVAPPEGMTIYQWRALQALAAGGQVTGRMGAILRGRGLLDDAGGLTEQARTLLDQHATDGASTKESTA